MRTACCRDCVAQCCNASELAAAGGAVRYWEYPLIPAVDRFKFLTYGKFMVNVCRRWGINKLDDLQAAWFNGAGYETWENVWGTWCVLAATLSAKLCVDLRACVCERA